MSSIDPKGFVQDFVTEYLDRGFGMLAKRDFEVLVFHLLHKHGYFGSKIDFFDASKKLRISERRVRNLYEDVQLRYSQYTDQEACERFVRLFEQQRFERDSQGRYKFQIRDPLLRQYLEEWIDSVKGIADSSFSPTLVVVSRDVLLDVLEKLIPHQKLEDYKKALPPHVDREIKAETTKRGILGRFFDKYVDTLAEGAAKATITMVGVGLRSLLGLPT